MSQKKPKVSWSNLPIEIVRSIAGSLQENADDLNSFRLTCKTWRRGTAICTILPLTINSSPRKKLYYSTVSLLRPKTSDNDVPARAYSPWMVSAVEAAKGDIQFCHPFSKDPLLSWSLVEGSFEFNQFQSTKLAVSYHLMHADGEDNDNFEFEKVLLVPTHSLPSGDDCGLLALHDGGRLGGYVSFKNQDDDDGDELELPWIEVKLGIVKKFDDIIMYKGMILVLNRQGKLHAINGKKLEIISTFVDHALSQVGRTRYRGCRRRCVTSSNGKLYLVERVSQRLLKVYKLYEDKSGNKWVEVKTLGDKVLFVTRDCCFFASASEFSTCNLTSCIVFSNDAFPKYARTRWELPDPSKSGSEISVFRLGGHTDYNFKPISRFTGFPLLLWSCPPWAWNAGSSPCEFQRETDKGEETPSGIVEEAFVTPSTSACQRLAWNAGSSHCHSQKEIEENRETHSNARNAIETEKDQEMLFDANSLDVPSPASFEPDSGPMEQYTEARSTSVAQGSILRAETPSSLVPEIAKQTIEMPSTSATNESIRTEMPSSSLHVAEKASRLETLRPENHNTHSASQAYINSINQSKENDNSTVKFEGMDIKSNLLETLQTMWSKHGNLIENSIIRTGDLVARALESLATVVFILEGTSVRALSDSQADYLKSTLSDLQCMHFKVDWLVPYVEKATQLHKSKPLVDSRDQLVRCQAKLVERKAKLAEELAELNQLEKELEGDVVSATRLIPFSGSVDFDQPVGCGLS